MARSDAEHLAELEQQRDDLMDALGRPAEDGPFSGKPDRSGDNSLQRMPARAQLRSELRDIEAQIVALRSRMPITRVSRAVT